MSFSNLSLMREARSAMAPHWGIGVVVTFVYLIFVGSTTYIFPGLQNLIPFILTGPFTLGFAYFSFAISRGETPEFKQLFEGFQVFVKSFLAYLIYSILCVIGFVLFIIPGFIVVAGFGLTFYVMADHPELSFTECLNESWRLMDGRKLKFIGLTLRFIPWYLLGILCLGVGVLLVIPWHYVAMAKFYEQVKGEARYKA
ncbi:MAG: DUF975 family protein [Flavobacteriaceae bacterium]